MVSFTANSLLLRCGIAAAAYYLPQDLGIGAILALNVKSNSNKLTGIKDNGPPLGKVDGLVKNFMTDHGFSLDSYRIEYSPRHTVVDLYD